MVACCHFSNSCLVVISRVKIFEAFFWREWAFVAGVTPLLVQCDTKDWDMENHYRMGIPSYL